MYILILHGENTNDSFKRMAEVIAKCKEKDWEILRLNSSDQSLAELISSPSLFAKKRLLVVEKISEVSKKDMEWLNKNGDNSSETIVFYSDKLLTAPTIKSFPKSSKIEEFKLPKYIWNFLDSFFPGNVKNSIYLLKKVLEREASELVVALLARHLSSLYITKIDRSKLGLPEWRVTKLSSQASRFTKEKIEEVIAELAKIDVESKTSKSNLADSLDMLIIKTLG